MLSVHTTSIPIGLEWFPVRSEIQRAAQVLEIELFQTIRADIQRLAESHHLSTGILQENTVSSVSYRIALTQATLLADRCPLQKKSNFFTLSPNPAPEVHHCHQLQNRTHGCSVTEGCVWRPYFQTGSLTWI